MLPLTQIHLVAPDLDFAKSPARQKIKMLYGNSLEFDCSPWSNSVDLIFVDGGHDVPTASADTKNALLMVTKEKPSCIFWHDYRNRDCEALTEYLDDLSESLEIFHIEDTMLCVTFPRSTRPHQPASACERSILNLLRAIIIRKRARLDRRGWPIIWGLGRY